MRFRRIAAVILTLPLLHLNVERADIACDRHDDASPATQEADARAGHAAHGSHQPDDPAPPRQVPVDDSASTECCQAFASCSFAFGGGSVAALDAVIASEVRVPTPARRAPLSRINAPEPPPPKA